ncbi:apoptotic chromatin condensation inducer in the nucleus [Microplitis mediator]|uniref:apoptotic chromatin condensation inducer in the nucleus n=1 Tax=Microplitis mediator TaxID=375433 RepID=UPI002557339A|nr:apoptotic chromatin condensation inducer in the nucleus [Microplitis mediator]
MRRKSERNKSKSSPEKKTEKPTRKSTRRRAKRSPSTSPDRENSNDVDTLTSSDKESTVSSYKTRLHSSNKDRENVETIIEEPEKVSSTDNNTSVANKQQEDQDMEDGGSVWKAARADASPGEIPKLKLCRQRNLSETSDVSLSRKRTSKWQESGSEGGIAEEADSADEKPASSSSSSLKMTTTTNVGDEPADDPSSTIPGRDSGEEVSDCKEFPSENASAELSDDKQNIDRPPRGDAIDDETNDSSTNTSCINTDTNLNDVKVPVDDSKPDNSKTDDLTTGIVETTSEIGDTTTEVGETAKEDGKTDTEVGEAATEVGETNTESGEAATEVVEPTVEIKETTAVEEKIVGDEPADVEETETEVKTAVESPEVDSEKQKEAVVDDEKVVEEAEKVEKPEEDKDDSAKDQPEATAKAEPARKDTSSEDEKDKKKSRRSQSSDSNDDKPKSKVKRMRRTSRRKHRDKYQDSSNSDTPESDDDQVRKSDKEEEGIKLEVTPEKSPFAQEATEATDRSPETEIVLSHQNDSIAEIDAEVHNNTKEPSTPPLEKSEAAAVIPASTKPNKVNLKRSFSRVTAEKPEKPEVDSNDASHNKENHVSSGQVEASVIPKRRRWGTLSTDTAPTLAISTDSLKALVPGAKPLSMSEVRLSKDDDEDRDRRREKEKRHSANEGPMEKPKEDGEATKLEVTKSDNHIAARRKISIVKDIPTKSPSPLPAQPTSVLLIKNLVRPFTLNQIKELLSRTGSIVENGFWMDRIKSKCFVEYSNEDQAFETRQALHGISWPLSNPKKLQVEYATKEEMEQARESSKDQVPLRKTEPMTAADAWQQEWGRDEKTNSTTKVTVVREWDLGKEDGHHLMKEKDREKKEMEKKRRQRSRSPAANQHLPPPARKFKKKEDDPPPAKLLDDLFRKTKATPCIYWLPLTNEQIVVKEEMRRQHMAEHARRLEEMRRAERNRDNRRRRSPRK